MNNLVVFLFLGAAALLAQAEHCFNEDIVKTEWLPLKDACKGKITIEAGDDETMKNRKLTKCIVMDMGWLKDGVFNYDAFKTEAERVLIGQKTEVLKIMDDCWESAGDDATKLITFFTCYKPKINVICSDALQWD